MYMYESRENEDFIEIQEETLFSIVFDIVKNTCATMIRSCYMSYKIRRKINFFSQLPDDVWFYILDFAHNKTTIYDRINVVVHRRF